LVEEKILIQAARRENLTITDEEKKAYLAKLEGGVEAGPQMTWDSPDLMDRLLIEKYTYLLVKDITVEDAEIDEYYELHKRDFLEQERVKVSQILLQTEEKAVEVYERVKDSAEPEFREIARRESAGPESVRGGSMGVFKPGELPDEMEKVVFSLNEGEVSPVVESSYGYHIFRLDQRFAPELVSRDDAAAAIRLKILDRKADERFEERMEELKAELRWSAAPENLSFTYQRNFS
jgi:parvulin-like peptidyl-prolyl isomerase